MNASTPDTVPAADAEPSDAVELLVRQHRRLEKLVDVLLQAGTDAERSAALGAAGDELAMHLAAEEQVFYPAVRAARTEDILLESLEEHLSLKRLLADLLLLPPGEPTFAAKCKVLDEQLEHHHGEEEESLFPRVQALLNSDRRVQLGLQMLQVQASMHLAGRPRLMAAVQTQAAEALDPAPRPD